MSEKTQAARDAYEAAIREAAVDEYQRLMGERWEAYYAEVKRVLEVNNVDSNVIYDAFHNASIILTNVIQRQAASAREVTRPPTTRGREGVAECVNTATVKKP